MFAKRNSIPDSDDIEDIDIGFSDLELQKKEASFQKEIIQLLDVDAINEILNAVHLQPIKKIEFDQVIGRCACLYSILSEKSNSAIVDTLGTDIELRWCLLILVKSSATVLKDSPNIELTAARAITILNVGRISFSGMDLRDVHIPEADLSYGVFDSTQFQRADLSRIQLGGSWLRNANFTNSKMNEVQFGEMPFLIFEENEIINVACSPDGYWIGLSVKEDTLLYESNSLIHKKTLYGATGSICFNPAGTLLVSSGKNKTIKFWEVSSGKMLQSLEVDTRGVNSIAFNLNGILLAFGGDDGDTRVS